MLVRARQAKISERRRLINEREYNLLDFLVWETEPYDPFSDRPSKRLRLKELLESPYLREAYKNVSTRTFTRELIRLRECDFIKFSKAASDDWVVEMDFNAIGKY